MSKARTSLLCSVRYRKTKNKEIDNEEERSKKVDKQKNDSILSSASDVDSQRVPIIFLEL